MVSSFLKFQKNKNSIFFIKKSECKCNDFLDIKQKKIFLIILTTRTQRLSQNGAMRWNFEV